MAAERVSACLWTVAGYMLRTLSRQLSQQAAHGQRDPAAEAAKVIRAASIPATAFEVGVLNLVFLAWLVGSHPEWYHVAYVIEFPVILGLVTSQWIKSGRCLYFCEFCWVVNLLGWVYLLGEILPFASSSYTHLLSPAARLGLARSFFATANGPLALSVLALSNALVFHDPERIGSVFIHFGPALTTHSIRWKHALLQATWPGAFGAAALEVGVDPAGSAACQALKGGPGARAACAAAERMELTTFTAPLTMYAAWWVVYGVWLLAIGCVLPERRGWRSSFGDMRPICALVCRRLLGVGKDAVRCHAAVYLLIHASLVALSLGILPSLLYTSATTHSAFLVVLIVAAVRQGANYYKHAWGTKLAKQVAARLKEA